MNRPRVGGRDRRAIIAGLAVVGATLGIGRALPAYLEWTRQARAAAEESQQALARVRTLLARSDRTRDSALARGRRMIALAPRLLAGDTPNGAGATLDGLLSGSAAQSGVRLGAIQLRSDTLSRDAFTLVGAHVEATGDIRGITRLLVGIERGPALLAVTSMAISQSEPSAGDDRAEALRVELDVEGLMLNPLAKGGR